jgi:hypothetical protein
MLASSIREQSDENSTKFTKTGRQVSQTEIQLNWRREWRMMAKEEELRRERESCPNP